MTYPKMIYNMTVHELLPLLRQRQIGVSELTQLYLERIRKYDGLNGLNTVAELDKTAMETAKALDDNDIERSLPLFGIPILIKDNIDVKGLHTTAGSAALADNIALYDSPVVKNLRRNGAVILGKTNMTEFANYTTQNMPNGYSSQSGQVKNAYDRSIEPSGSSSGSAVAVSAGLCAAAIGTDTSFSVIGCATVNGVTGLKPPSGALSQDGIIPISHTLDSVGTLTRDMSDALLVYSGMRTEKAHEVTHAAPQNIHIAVNTFNREKISEAQLERYDVLFDALRCAGVQINEVSHPYQPYQADIMRCEFRHYLERYLMNSGAKLKTLAGIVDYYEQHPEQMMKYGDTLLRSSLYEASGQLDDDIYIKAMAEREMLRKQLISEISQYDACVMTGPTNIMHFVGIPSVALRLCMAKDNTPRGIVLYGADEFRLYSAALTIEKYCLPVHAPIL